MEQVQRVFFGGLQSQQYDFTTLLLAINLIMSIVYGFNRFSMSVMKFTT